MPPPKHWPVIAAVVVLVIALVAACLPTLARRLLIEYPADEPVQRMLVEDLQGRPVDVASGANLAFVVVTARSGSAGCVLDKPDIAALAREFGRDLFFAVVICGKWNGTELSKAAHAMGLEGVPVYGYAATDGNIIPPFVRGIPTKILVRNGKVVARELGSSGMTRRMWSPLLAAASRAAPN